MFAAMTNGRAGEKLRQVTLRQLSIASILAVMALWLSAATAWAQPLEITGGELGAMITLLQVQTPSALFEASVPTYTFSSSLSVDFDIADFVQGGNFSLDLSNDGMQIKTQAALSLPIMLSEILALGVDFSEASKYSTVIGVLKELKVAFGLSSRLQLDPLQISMKTLLEHNISPPTPVNDFTSAQFQLEAQASFDNASATLSLGVIDRFVHNDPEKNTLTLSASANTQANLGVLSVKANAAIKREIGQSADDPIGDANNDGCPGVCGVDDDGDGLIDEDSHGFQPSDGVPPFTNDLINDDNENGLVDELATKTDVDFGLEGSVSQQGELFDVQATASWKQSGRLEDAKSVKQTLHFDGSLTYKGIEGLGLTISGLQETQQFSSAPEKNTSTSSVGIEASWDLMGGTVSVKTKQTHTAFPNDSSKDRDDLTGSLSFSFPLSDLVTLDITPLELTTRSFPNDPSMMTQITRNYSAGLTARVTAESFELSAGASLSGTLFPDAPQDNTVSLKASSSLTITPVEDVEVTLQVDNATTAAQSKVTSTLGVSAKF